MADQEVRPARDATSSGGYAFRLRGHFAARRLPDDADVTPRGRKARALLAYLLVERDPVLRDRLAGLLWSESGQPQAQASLRQCLAELRTLGPLVEADRMTVRLGDGGQTDMAALDAAALAGRAGELANLLEGGELALLEGLDGLDPVFDQWLRTTRAAWSTRLVAAGEACCRHAMDRGDVESAARLAVRLEALDPLDEGLARLAMEAGHRAGKQDLVHRVYERLAAELRRELGAAPSSETTRLYQELKLSPGPRDSTGLEPTAADAPDAAAERRMVTGSEARRRWWRWAPAALLFVVAVAALVVAVGALRGGSDPPATLAVLPFRTLSAGDEYFAEGVSEEILDQLARQPDLRVVGRTSAAMFRDARDAREIGRRLEVSYVVEGSVRRAGRRVRVNVALVSTADGLRMWTETFDGTLDDIFSIQGRIGSAVADRLGQELVQAGASPGPLRTRGDVYALYVTARSLLHERRPATVAASREIFARIVALDPGYAPGWAGLAAAWGIWPQSPEQTQRALGYARRALALGPELPAAHGAAGMILGYDHPAGSSHLKRAAALAPNDPELVFWAAQAYFVEGDYAQALEHYRRAISLDPLWYNAWSEFVTFAWSLGDRGEAQQHARWVEAHGTELQAHVVRSVLAATQGDISTALGHLVRARRTDYVAAGFEASKLLAVMGDYRTARRAIAEPPQVWDSGRPVEGANLRALLARFSYNPVDTSRAFVAVKQAIDAGNARELAEVYDSETGLLGRSSRRPSNAIGAEEPLIVLVLRRSGRTHEAERLLARHEAAVDRLMRGGRPTFRFAAQVAAPTYALRGRREDALAALETSVRLGWTNTDQESIADPGDEPAFAALRGDRRFERIRAFVNAHRARELREIAALGI